MDNSDSLPAIPSPDPLDLAQRIAEFHGTAYRYLAQRLASAAQESKNATLAKIGVTKDSLDRWRWQSQPFRELDNAIEYGDLPLRAHVATAILQDQAPRSAANLGEMANATAKTDRQLQAKLQANVKVLEAVGVLRQGAGVQVNVDARRIDVAARELWEQRGKRAWRGEKEGPGDVKAPSGGGGEALPQS